ncbi:hypothetical protein TNCV_625121 [Trichonephila clavipes]|nr:hypothetical protein TNCV_625121 [Trichonephila clavipes]
MANNQSVRRHLMLLPEVESREIGGRPQCDKCGCRVRIAHSIVSMTLRQFQTTGTAISGVQYWSSTTNHTSQMTGTLSYRAEETGGTQSGRNR